MNPLRLLFGFGKAQKLQESIFSKCHFLNLFGHYFQTALLQNLCKFLNQITKPFKKTILAQMLKNVLHLAYHSTNFTDYDVFIMFCQKTPTIENELIQTKINKIELRPDFWGINLKHFMSNFCKMIKEWQILVPNFV